MEALIADPLGKNMSIDSILQDARKMDLFSGIVSKQNVQSMMNLAKDMDIMQEQSMLFHTPEPFLQDQSIIQNDEN